jgi:hypothetical protein
MSPAGYGEGVVTTTEPRLAAAEQAILAAVREGATVAALLDRWPMVTVSGVIQRHRLVVDEDGRIGRSADGLASDVASDVASVAAWSPNPAVRKAAEEALLRQRRLAEVLAEDRVQHHRDELLELQIEAVTRWQAWLAEAQRAATAEHRRLTKRRGMRRVRARRAEDAGRVA